MDRAVTSLMITRDGNSCKTNCMSHQLLLIFIFSSAEKTHTSSFVLFCFVLTLEKWKNVTLVTIIQQQPQSEEQCTVSSFICITLGLWHFSFWIFRAKKISNPWFVLRPAVWCQLIRSGHILHACVVFCEPSFNSVQKESPYKSTSPDLMFGVFNLTPWCLICLVCPGLSLSADFSWTMWSALFVTVDSENVQILLKLKGQYFLYFFPSSVFFLMSHLDVNGWFIVFRLFHWRAIIVCVRLRIGLWGLWPLSACWGAPL